ncbi:MAG TPA: BON domain-containing protein [Gemmatimonadaceae bacterium]
MARDFEDINDLDDLSDDELRGVVRDHLAAHNGLDIDDLSVRVDQGTVILGGRVGTDGERLVAEHIVTDTLGIEHYRNDIFVDRTRRATSPEAADEHLVDEDRREGLLLGDRAVPISPEVEEVADDLDADLYGTTDVRKAIEDGTPWIPPESPTQEGFVDQQGETGENH